MLHVPGVDPEIIPELRPPPMADRDPEEQLTDPMEPIPRPAPADPVLNCITVLTMKGASE